MTERMEDQGVAGDFSDQIADEALDRDDSDARFAISWSSLKDD